jgi:hypothetical protein
MQRLLYFCVDRLMRLTMYVYIMGGPIGPCTMTYSGLLCFPFYSSPQQSCTSNEMQDLARGCVEIVIWIHKMRLTIKVSDWLSTSNTCAIFKYKMQVFKGIDIKNASSGKKYVSLWTTYIQKWRLALNMLGENIPSLPELQIQDFRAY